MRAVSGLFVLVLLGHALFASGIPCSADWYVTDMVGFKEFVSSGCSSVGSLAILGVADLFTLEGMEFLNSAGKLRIESNPDLKDLVGLGNLSTVPSYFHLFSNEALSSTDALKSLEKCGEFNLVDNVALQSLRLPSLTLINGSMTIKGHNSLETVELPNVVSIGQPSGSLSTLQNNAKLTRVDFDNLITIEDSSFEISTHPYLSTVNFPALEEVGKFTIQSNDSPSLKLTGFSALSQINGDLVISENAGLEEVSFSSQDIGFSGSKVTITYNGNLRDVSVELVPVESYSGTTLVIEYNGKSSGASPGDISGLNKVINAYYLSIRYNNNLASLSGFNGLVKTMSSSGLYPASSAGLLIYDNTPLKTITGFQAFAGDTNSYDFWISSHNLLESISGFQSMVGGGKLRSVTLKDMQSLKSIDGFSKLQRMTSTLQIQNTGLEDLDALQSLESVSQLQIEKNNNLKSIEGVGDIESVYNRIYIDSNKELSNCLNTMCYLCSTFYCYNTGNNGPHCTASECTTK